LRNYTVLPASRELYAQWVRITLEARKKGRPVQTADAWIAASALHYQVPLITNNAGDYAAIDELQVITA
jgi:predicted nucleic acid-binding protein